MAIYARWLRELIEENKQIRGTRDVPRAIFVAEVFQINAANILRSYNGDLWNTLIGKS